MSIILLAISVTFFIKGFDFKNNYFNDENNYKNSINAYVGADAYNFIINANYFTGYITIGTTSALGAVILLSTSLILIGQDRQFDGLRAIYEKIPKQVEWGMIEE